MDLLNAVKGINNVLWNYVLIFLLCGAGVVFTVSLKFVQVSKFKESFKKAFGGMSLKGKKAGKDGMSSFQSLATAVAAQVGTGNLAGAATAIVSGGPGA
ncbi:TPA: alanine:cation symporter family protein, partial [Clostridium botulinum]